jgi:predicted transcriptional regulator
MKVFELAEQLGLSVFTPTIGMENEITGGYISDLLSDVMGNASEGNVWITLQNHLNVVAIASLKDLACVVLVKGIEPSDDVVKKAISENVAILGSNENTFELAGKIFKMLG